MRKIKLMSATALSILSLGIGVSIASADIQTDTIDEKWGKPTLVYGESLDDGMVQQVNDAFKVKKIENVNRQVTSGADFQKYMGVQSSPALYSSALLANKDKGNGINVKIVTPENITKVTANQYMNAAITAGATDLDIEVASPVPVTGESALVGVSKALEANGQKVDTARAEVANKEVSTVSTIAEENKANKDFDSSALDLAMAQIKTELAKYKQENGKVADNAKITEIVNKALKDKGLDKIISAEQVQQIVSFADAYQNTSAIDSKEVQNQLEDYAKKTYNTLSEKYQKFVNSDEAKGMWENVKGFFYNLWGAITGMFN